eukprot:scaffold565_cov379-Pinguiococcus_pyrenoidosus.AAC.24
MRREKERERERPQHTPGVSWLSGVGDSSDLNALLREVWWPAVPLRSENPPRSLATAAEMWFWILQHKLGEECDVHCAT